MTPKARRRGLRLSEIRSKGSSLAGSVESAFVSIPAGAVCSLRLSFLLPLGFVTAAAPTRTFLAVSATHPEESQSLLKLQVAVEVKGSRTRSATALPHRGSHKAGNHRGLRSIIIRRAAARPCGCRRKERGHGKRDLPVDRNRTVGQWRRRRATVGAVGSWLRPRTVA